MTPAHTRPTMRILIAALLLTGCSCSTVKATFAPPEAFDTQGPLFVCARRGDALRCMDLKTAVRLAQEPADTQGADL